MDGSDLEAANLDLEKQLTAVRMELTMALRVQDLLNTKLNTAIEEKTCLQKELAKAKAECEQPATKAFQTPPEESLERYRKEAETLKQKLLKLWKEKARSERELKKQLEMIKEAAAPAAAVSAVPRISKKLKWRLNIFRFVSLHLLRENFVLVFNTPFFLFYKKCEQNKK